MNALDLFAGAGGAAWAGKLLGWKTVGYVEQDEYCQKVIRQRVRDGIFDDAPIFSDVRTFDGLPYRGKVDIITAGFPCQPFSVAGRQAGENDERNMWPDTVRIIGEVRPAWCLLENVPGIINSYLGTILNDLAACGYDASWRVLSAAEVGAPHKRDRLWIMAHAERVGKLQPEGRKQDERRRARNSGQEMAYPDSSMLERQGRAVGVQSQHGDIGRSSWWETEPAVGRVVDGMADRRNRLKALGNGWVPIVAATAWEILTEIKR